MKVYGPYIRKKDGRKHVVIYDPTATPKRTTVSYPKYLMEQHLGRKLTDDETVDHIDEDYTNDAISNLRIIPRADNAKRSAPKMILVDGQCAMCGSDIHSYSSANEVRTAGQKMRWAVLFKTVSWSVRKECTDGRPSA